MKDKLIIAAKTIPFIGLVAVLVYIFVYMPRPEKNRYEVQRLFDEMKNDSWYVKLMRWYKLKVWTYKCLTRKYWDRTFNGYIFKQK